MLVSVVAHELAHVQRQDMLWHLVSEILLIPLAFHPLSYVLRNRLAETREMACDALVAERVLPATDYARTLLDVAGTLRNSAAPLLLSDRVRVLAKPTAKRKSWWVRLLSKGE
jgi:beta-lactamase regulating signal transducer with metallopeptidase domain